MKMNELFENYPKTTEIVREWFMNKMLESLNDQSVSEEFKEYMRNQGISNDNLFKVFEENPRALLDVLDENDVYINVTRDFENKTFRYSFDGKVESEDFAKRKDAEMNAVERAFFILEEKLNKTE